MSVEATAQNNIITVFMRTVPEFANKHNDMYWDDASVISIGTPVPPPTNTPLPATDTPVPSNTPPVTDTPVPPTATNTASPTPTTEATETSLPTSAPTSAPTVTETAPPTNTPTSAPPSETPEAQNTVALASPSPQGTEVASNATESAGEGGGSGFGSELPAGVGLIVLGVAFVLLIALIVGIFLSRQSG
jgi:hypothetical protein